MVDESQQDPATHPGAVGPEARIVRGCGDLLDELGGDGISVSVRADREVGDLIHATDHVSAALEEIQAVLGEGPACDAYADSIAVGAGNLDDVAALHRWPGFAREAAGTEARAVLAVPLQVEAATFGHVELYRRDPGEFVLTERAVHLVAAVADAVLALFEAAPTGTDQGFAGESTSADPVPVRRNDRPDLHVAVGIVAVQLGISVGDAMARLCAAAFSADLTLQRLAHDVVAGHRRLVDDVDGAPLTDRDPA